jgi:hypothetical protein
MRVSGVIVAGFLLSAGVATAETVVPPTASIIPVTGPSLGPGPSESPKPELIPAMVATDTKAVNATPNGGTPTGHPASRTLKVAHKPGTKNTVKKTPATTKHVAKTAGSTKVKHVAATKPKPPARQAMVGKPIPVTKHHAASPAAKGGGPAQPVLPRV